jgi:hypothetical protein
LVLEQLPLASDRENYLQQRRRERGRPEKFLYSRHVLAGNIKAKWEDEVPEWFEEDEESNYHTFVGAGQSHFYIALLIIIADYPIWTILPCPEN